MSLLVPWLYNSILQESSCLRNLGNDLCNNAVIITDKFPPRMSGMTILHPQAWKKKNTVAHNKCFA